MTTFKSGQGLSGILGWCRIDPAFLTVAAVVGIPSALGIGFGIGMATLLNAGHASVREALLDPTFVVTAARAGYRVEEGLGKGPAYVLARCARSDASGPVACDPFPAGEYPTIPGDREVRVRVLP